MEIFEFVPPQRVLHLYLKFFSLILSGGQD